MRGEFERHDSALVTGQKLLCGGIAGCCAKTSIAPLERVKILFQVNSQQYPYTGVWSTLRRIHSREGFNGLYKGNLSSIVRVFPYAAVQFATFDHFKQLLTPVDKDVSGVGNFCAGALAGAAAVTLTYPLDMTRARLALQVHKKHYDGLWHALKTMYYHEGGVRALYRGMQPTMVGILPYAGINFFTYDTLKYTYTHRWAQDSVQSQMEHGIAHDDAVSPKIPVLPRLAFGAIAGICGQTATYPLDVARRRMQIDGLRLETTYSYKYRGAAHAIRTIYATEGIKALYRGLHINYVKVVPLVSVSFAINDWLRGLMGLSTDGGVHRHKKREP